MKAAPGIVAFIAQVRYSIPFQGMSLCLCSTAPRYTSVHVPLWLQRTTHHESLPKRTPPGHPTTGPSLPTVADELLANKERYSTIR
jgi:hypothetical protein